MGGVRIGGSLAVAALVGLSATSAARTAATRAEAAGIPLAPTPPAVLRFCRDRAHRHKFPVLCPTHWPRVSNSLVTSSGRIVLGPSFYWGSFNDESGFDDGDDGHLVIGGQRPPFALQGAVEQEWPRGGQPQPLKLLLLPERGRIVRLSIVRGARALVLAAPAYPAGGFMGGHVIVVWNRRGHGYFVSLHYDGSRSGATYSLHERVAAALAIARSAQPIGG